MHPYVLPTAALSVLLWCPSRHRTSKSPIFSTIFWDTQGLFKVGLPGVNSNWVRAGVYLEVGLPPLKPVTGVFSMKTPTYQRWWLKNDNLPPLSRHSQLTPGYPGCQPHTMTKRSASGDQLATFSPVRCFSFPFFPQATCCLGHPTSSILYAHWHTI